MDGPAAAPVLEMRLGVESCTLGPFPVPACKCPPRRPYRYARPLPSPETRRGGGPSPLKAAPERAAEGGRLEDQPRCPVGTNRGNRGTNSGNHGTVGRTVGRSARGTNRGNRGTSPCLTNRVASSAGSRHYSRLRVGERTKKSHIHTRVHTVFYSWLPARGPQCSPTCSACISCSPRRSAVHPAAALMRSTCRSRCAL
jgi:hypothetical protein